MDYVCETNSVLVSGTTNISGKLLSAIHQQVKVKNRKCVNENIRLVLYTYLCNTLHSFAKQQSNKLISSRNFIDKKTLNVSIPNVYREKPSEAGLLQTVLDLLQMCKEEDENGDLEKAAALYEICFDLSSAIDDRKFFNIIVEPEVSGN